MHANGSTYQFAQQLSASESMFALGTRITEDDDDLVTNFPSSGTTEGDLFRWQGGSDLAPELRAVSRDLEDE